MPTAEQTAGQEANQTAGQPPAGPSRQRLRSDHRAPLGLILPLCAGLLLGECRPGAPLLSHLRQADRRPPPVLPASAIVRPGDSLAVIALRELGDASRWPEIYLLNRDRIGEDPHRLRPGMVLTLHEDLPLAALRATMPALPPELAQAYLGPLNQAMWEFGITTRERAACFLAQLAHESGELQYFEETGSGERYEGRCADLGNCAPGDGIRYKGRGPIQLTGRRNYRLAGAAIGADLEDEPELVASKDLGFRVAAWFFRYNGLNELADRGDFGEITRRINGGTTGQASREQYWARARAALVPTPAPPGQPSD